MYQLPSLSSFFSLFLSCVALTLATVTILNLLCPKTPGTTTLEPFKYPISSTFMSIFSPPICHTTGRGQRAPGETRVDVSSERSNLAGMRLEKGGDERVSVSGRVLQRNRTDREGVLVRV